MQHYEENVFFPYILFVIEPLQRTYNRIGKQYCPMEDCEPAYYNDLVRCTPLYNTGLGRP